MAPPLVYLNDILISIEDNAIWTNTQFQFTSTDFLVIIPILQTNKVKVLLQFEGANFTQWTSLDYFYMNNILENGWTKVTFILKQDDPNQDPQSILELLQ